MSFASPRSAISITAAPPTAGSLQPLFSQISESADILVLCGDLTDYGLAEEARALVARDARRSRFPPSPSSAITTSNPASRTRCAQILLDAGVVTLDGDSTEILGIGFAGVKGFAGGFGRRALGPWGEDIIKRFVHEAVDEALKLESALARLRNDHLIAVLHYAPIQATVEGEPRRDLSVPGLQPPRGAAQPLPGHRRVPRPRAPRAARGTHREERPRLQRVDVADARAVSRRVRSGCFEIDTTASVDERRLGSDRRALRSCADG